MRYNIIIIEKLGKVVAVDAASQDEAMGRVRDAYADGVIPEPQKNADYLDTEFLLVREDDEPGFVLGKEAE